MELATLGLARDLWSMMMLQNEPGHSQLDRQKHHTPARLVISEINTILTLPMTDTTGPLAEGMESLSLSGTHDAPEKIKENINIVFVGHVGTDQQLLTVYCTFRCRKVYDFGTNIVSFGPFIVIGI